MIVVRICLLVVCLSGLGACAESRSIEERIRSKIDGQDLELGFTAIVPEYVPEGSIDNPRSNIDQATLQILLFSPFESELALEFRADIWIMETLKANFAGPTRQQGAELIDINGQVFSVLSDEGPSESIGMHFATRFGRVGTTISVTWISPNDQLTIELNEAMEREALAVVESMVDNASKLGISPDVPSSVRGPVTPPPCPVRLFALYSLSTKSGLTATHSRETSD